MSVVLKLTHAASNTAFDSCLSHSRLTTDLLLYLCVAQEQNLIKMKIVIDFLYNGLLFCVLQDACSYFLERMVTRSTAIKLSKVLHSGHVFHSKEKLPSEKLPTKRDVIERPVNEN